MAKKGTELDGGSDGPGAQGDVMVIKGSPGEEPKLSKIMDVLTVDPKYRLKVGVAFWNKDESLTILLNAFPCNRRLRVQTRKNGDRPPKS